MRLLNLFKIIKPKIKIILTVSPIPLVATKTLQNVLVASSYSKAVLRAASGDIEQQYDNVAYFPSFEIINSPASLGQYLSDDLREVTENGVACVMSCFLNSFYGEINLPKNSDKDLNFINHLEPQKIQSLPECEEVFNISNS